MSYQSAPMHPDTTGSSTTWTVVPQACTATFTVRDKLVATVRGTLPVISGTALVDAASSVIRASVELAVAGIATGNPHRDRDLQKRQFLDAARHPTISVDTGPTTPRDTGWIVPARLAARGTSFPLELHLTMPSSDDRHVRLRITATLDRSGLHMPIPTFIIGRNIQIDVDALFERLERD